MSEAQVEPQAAAAHDDHDTLAEEDRLNLRIIVAAALGVIVLVIIGVIYVRNYFAIEMRRELSEKVLTVENPELRELRAAEEAKLNKYQWVDKKAGTVRIPVERAQELTLRDWNARVEAAAAAERAEAAAATAEGEGAEEGATEATGGEGSPSNENDPKPADAMEGAEE